MLLAIVAGVVVFAGARTHCESDGGVGFCAVGDTQPFVDWDSGEVEVLPCVFNRC